jgi:hypothetical protein
MALLDPAEHPRAAAFFLVCWTVLALLAIMRGGQANW